MLTLSLSLQLHFPQSECAMESAVSSDVAIWPQLEDFTEVGGMWWSHHSQACVGQKSTFSRDRPWTHLSPHGWFSVTSKSLVGKMGCKGQVLHWHDSN